MASEGGSGLRIDPVISLGHLMALIPLLGVAFTAMWWLVTNAKQIEDTSKELRNFQAEVRDEFKAMQNEQIKSLQEQLSKLPELQAHLAADERAINELRATNMNLQDRINSAASMAGQAVQIMRDMSQPEIPIRRTR